MIAHAKLKAGIQGIRLYFCSLLKLLGSDGKPLSAAQQRDVRAVRVLERTATAEARQVLDGLLKESPAWWVRREAKEALKRLGPGDKAR